MSFRFMSFDVLLFQVISFIDCFTHLLFINEPRAAQGLNIGAWCSMSSIAAEGRDAADAVAAGGPEPELGFSQPAKQGLEPSRTDHEVVNVVNVVM